MVVHLVSTCIFFAPTEEKNILPVGLPTNFVHFGGWIVSFTHLTTERSMFFLCTGMNSLHNEDSNSLLQIFFLPVLSLLHPTP